MLVYAKEFGSYFRGATVRNPTLVLEQLMTEVYASDFVVDAWLEPTFEPSSASRRPLPDIDALRDVILWSVTLAGICRALKRPLVKLSTVKVYDQAGHGRRRGIPTAGSSKKIGGLYLRAESLARQYYAATVVYRAPILYGAKLQSPINRCAEAQAGNAMTPRYVPAIETNEQMMLAFAGDFVDLLMQQIDAGPTDMPQNLWPYKNSSPLTWHDAALIAWHDKKDLCHREQGYRMKGSSTFTPDIHGEGLHLDGFRRYREEEKTHREEAERAIREHSKPRR